MKEEHFDLDIERAILSSCFKADILEEFCASIRSEDFYLPQHKELFESMLICTTNKEPISPSFIRKHKNIDEGVLAQVLGTTALIDLPVYVKELREMAIKRGLLSLAVSMPSRINRELKSQVIVDELTKDIYELSKDASTAVIKDAKEVIAELLKAYEEQKQRDDKHLLGLDTGFAKLNDMCKGFKEGELIILAARTGMGKTTLCLNFIQKVLRDDKAAVLFSLEMPATQIMQRLISEHTGVELQRVMTGELSDEEWGNVNDACKYFSSKKLFIHDSGYATILDVRAILRKLKSDDDDIALCALDYIQLMNSTTSYAERHLQVAEMSRGLKLLARELRIPIIALSQLNRELEKRSNKRPQLSDLRESGSIEQDADTILFVYRADVHKEAQDKELEAKALAEGKDIVKKEKEYKDVEDAELIVGKNRHGPTGIIPITFVRKQSTFKEQLGYSKQEPYL